MRDAGSFRRRWPAVFLPALILPAVALAAACSEDDTPPRMENEDAGAFDGPRVPSANDSMAPRVEADARQDTGLSPTFVHRDINHILSTGQSLSVGATGTPPLSTSQPFANLMFSNGAIPGPNNLTAFAPLVEGRVDGGANDDVETMSAGLANLITKMAREELLVGQPEDKTSHDLLVSVHGIGGTPYVGLKKGTGAFAAGLAQTKAAFDLAKSLGKSFVVRAVTNVHGESDHLGQNASYEQNLLEWQSDYETEVKAITGQSDPIPMLETQISSFTKLYSFVSAIPQAQLAAHVSSAGKIVLVGPKYHLPYSSDGLHLTSEGYRHMGEDYAKVYRRVVLEGRRWEPLRPLAVTRVGAIITVKFAVPAPPIVLDETLVTNPGGFGFEFAQTGPAAPTIAAVAVAGPDAITITLTSEPTGINQRIRYAFTGVPNAPSGPTTGPRGNVRDSDATTSRHGYPLYNWCVHFDEAVP